MLATVADHRLVGFPLDSGRDDAAGGVVNQFLLENAPVVRLRAELLIEHHGHVRALSYPDDVEPTRGEGCQRDVGGCGGGAVGGQRGCVCCPYNREKAKQWTIPEASNSAQDLDGRSLPTVPTAQPNI